MDERRYPVRRAFYDTEPGVHVLVETQRPHCEPKGEVVLVHGLEGSSSSGYMKSMAQALLEAGYVAHRFNLRSCGGTEAHARTGYHSGMTCDVREFLYQRRAAGAPALFLTGFSLGGNVVLKLAAELGDQANGWLRGVCAVSTPLDLYAASVALSERQNRLYEQRFLRKLKRRIERLIGPIPGVDRIRTLRQFDDRVTASIFGFRDAEHYYRSQSCLPMLDRIRIPALLVQAKDDPVIPYEMFERPEVSSNPRLELVAVEHGGHVGFIARRAPRFWPGAVVTNWLDGM